MPYKRKGTKNWWIVVAGIRRSAETDDFDDAKALEDRLNHQVWLQQHMGFKPAKSWPDAVVKYLKERAHRASYETIRQRLAWWHPHLGHVNDIRTISRDMIDTILMQHRPVTSQPSSANTTANKYAIVVGAVLNAACREWGWVESSPKLRRYPEPDHRRVFLSVEDWRRLEAELPEHLKLAATFALATGLRAGKVFGLEWRQIDMQARSMRTSGNAIKRGNTIPLNRTAMAVLEQIHGGDVRHIKRVFTYDGEPLNDYGKSWFKALHRAGLGEYKQWRDGGRLKSRYTGFPWHGLRHTFASWLGQAGAPETAIDQLCGWAEKDTRSIYTHLHVDALRPYAEIIDRTLSAQLEKTVVSTPVAA